MKCFIYVFLYFYIIGNIEAFLRLTFITNDPNSYAFCKPKYFSKQELLIKIVYKGEWFRPKTTIYLKEHFYVLITSNW